MLTLLSYFASTEKYQIKILEKKEESEVLLVEFRLCNSYKVKVIVSHSCSKYYFRTMLLLKEYNNFKDFELEPGFVSNYVVCGNFLKETEKAADDIRIELRKEIKRNLKEIIPNLSNKYSWQEVNLSKYRSEQNA